MAPLPGRDRDRAVEVEPAAAARARAVFISCPADAGYRPLLHAMCFTLRACGYDPRCALDHGGGEIGIAKMLDLIAACDLSIHDLSRTACDAGAVRPYAMPLALGIDLALRLKGPRVQRRRRTLILDAKAHGRDKAPFDILGRDIRVHGDDVGQVVAHVRDWLNVNRPDGTPPLPGALALQQDYEECLGLVPDLLRVLHLGPLETLGHSDFLFVMDRALLALAGRRG